MVDVLYQPRTRGLPLETFTLSSLTRRLNGDELDMPQRLGFELLVCCDAGFGHHEVDFERVDLAPGRILHVRPGQVHRWVLDPRYEARLFLLRELDHRSDWSPGPHVIETDGDLERDLATIVALADPDRRTTPLTLRSLEALRDLLIALLGLSLPNRQNASHREIVYDEFEHLLGETDTPPRTVQQCAQLLGCSTRTLTRACRSVAQSEPKALIDRAVAVEAQRRLSEVGASATRVAEALGFTEPSHFSRFFKRVTGETPTEFAAGYAQVKRDSPN